MRLGEWDVASDVELLPEQTYSVLGVNVHPKYENETLTNDLAIVTLAKAVKNEAHISPICLPPAKQTFAFGSCVVTGWGNKEPILKEAFVECIDDEDCEARLRTTKLGPYYKLNHGFLCATNRNQQTCSVDGGGPLVCKREDGTYALVGLVSWAVDCESEGIPEAYVRVQNYLEWISGQRVQTVPTVQTQQHESPARRAVNRNRGN